MGFDPWIRGSSGVGHSNPLQCSCLESLMAEEPGGPQSVGRKRGAGLPHRHCAVVDAMVPR